jgi:TctA family transporter
MTTFIPMLTLGIPGSASMALMMGALMVQGVSPGPRLVVDHPNLFWGVIASMWVGNLMLLVLNLPLVGIWIRLLAMDFKLLFPAIVVFCCVGVYSTDLSAFSVFLMAGFGLLGYVFVALGCPLPPLIMGFIMGPMLEENFRRSMLLSNGDPSIFVSRPISTVCVLAIAAFFLSHAYQLYRKRSAPRPATASGAPNAPGA